MHKAVDDYWIKVKKGEATREAALPKELTWLKIEVEPEKYAWPVIGLGQGKVKGYYAPPIYIDTSLNKFPDGVRSSAYLNHE